ncbi:MAG: response regulator transcription factor [Eubacterium sp.]|nr:response regulator transcription factor [Eubacterium sp.]
MYQILLAEDENTLRDILVLFFKKNGFEIDAVDNGIDACNLADEKKYDIIILDIMMPGKDGKEVCRYIRGKYDVPVIFLTALGNETDIVSGYELGADEYITKPFSTGILLAKVNALINRYHGLMVKDGKITEGELVIEPARRSVTVNGKAISLAPKEYDLLMCFLDHKEIILSRDQILDIVWGMDYDGVDRAVDTHIKKLRKQLGKASYHIETVIKAGYVWRK